MGTRHISSLNPLTNGPKLVKLCVMNKILIESICYRIGSIILGFTVNYIIFRSITFSLTLTMLFFVTHTIYYIIFKKMWARYLKYESFMIGTRNLP